MRSCFFAQSHVVFSCSLISVRGITLCFRMNPLVRIKILCSSFCKIRSCRNKKNSPKNIFFDPKTISEKKCILCEKNYDIFTTSQLQKLNWTWLYYSIQLLKLAIVLKKLVTWLKKLVTRTSACKKNLLLRRWYNLLLLVNTFSAFGYYVGRSYLNIA